MENAIELVKSSFVSSSIEIGVVNEFGAEDQFGATPNSEIEATKKLAVGLFLRLERARLEIGLKFGHVLIVLRNLKKASGEKDWMEYLESIGITYNAARYWIAKAKGEETNRHKKTVGPGKTSPSLEDWDQAAQQYRKFVHDVRMLKVRKPLTNGELYEPHNELTEILGSEVKGGTTHELLQRDRPANGGLAQATDSGRTDCEGGR